MEGLVRFAVVDVMTQLHFVARIVPRSYHLLLTVRRKELAKRILLDDLTKLDNVLGLIRLVDIPP